MSMILTLITPTPPDISAFGVRSISSYLRDKGHETRLIFLPGSIGLLKEGGEYVYRYDAKVLKQISDIARGSDVVGVSFMSSYLDRAIQITESVKSSLGVPVIWGGIHSSCKPEECLKYADMACIGEGETAMLEILQRMSEGRQYHDVEGVWFRRGEEPDYEIVKNGLRPLIRDLDSIPHFDFSNKGHYLFDYEQGGIVELDDAALKKTMPYLPYFGNRLKRAFRTMSDRGCPHKCSYCNVSNIKAMYSGSKTPYFRSRSVENVIDELVDIKGRFPFVEVIQFFDDTFFARSLKQLQQFAVLYKEKVGLPFYCQASPTTLTEEKLSCLIDAGLVYVEMGIQTGSKKIKELYHRRETNELIVEVAGIIQRYRSRLLQPDYHIILDNPWETEEDTLQTARLLLQLPKPFGLCISSLVFFPQTELYLKAVSEGLIADEMKDIYRKPFFLPPKKTYPNFLIYLLTFQHFPRWLLKLMFTDSAVRFFSRWNPTGLYRVSYSVGEAVRLMVKGVKALMVGDFGRISAFVKKIIAHDPVVAGRKS